MKLSELAAGAVGYFVTDERDDGTEFVKTADDTPEWLQSLIQDAHAHMFPDDWRYQAIRDVLHTLADLDFETADDAREEDGEILDGLVDLYTHDLTAWLGSRNDRMQYVDEWVEDFGSDGDTFQRLSGGQYVEYREILDSVLESLSEELEEREEAMETLTFNTLTGKLDAAGVEYRHLERGSDREALEVPGYGTVYYDDGQTSGNPGWVVRETETTGCDCPLTEHELLLELEELAGMAEAIR